CLLSRMSTPDRRPGCYTLRPPEEDDPRLIQSSRVALHISDLRTRQLSEEGDDGRGCISKYTDGMKDEATEDSFSPTHTVSRAEREKERSRSTATAFISRDQPINVHRFFRQKQGRRRFTQVIAWLLSQHLHAFPSMNHLHEKSFDSWNESDELDVFEATRYFSGAIDGTALQVGGFGSHGAVTVEDRVPSSVQKGNFDERLISTSSSLMKDNKCKQPSSPGARLVGLLNSFLHQAASGRKLRCLNPTSTTRETPEEGDAKEENSLGGRERRRSISRSQSTNSAGSKSSKFCGSSSFTNPDLYPYDYRTTSPISYKCNSGQKSVTFCPRIEAWGSASITELLHNSGAQKEKDYRLHGIRSEEKDAHDRENEKWVPNNPNDQYPGRDWFGDYKLPLAGVRKNSIKGEEEEEEEEVSDSSSDLFELKICDHAALSDGLPVFATTDIEAINRANTAS
ncbi:hypothetical protein GW17_00045349, partial [Ensete ventricosum]